MCQYRAIVHHEDGIYWAEVPALPGCYSDGETLEALNENLRQAIRFHIQGLNSFEVPEGDLVAQVSMKAMREGKTVARERWLESVFIYKYKIGSKFGKKSIVDARDGNGAIFEGTELLYDDWVVVNEKEDANGN